MQTIKQSIITIIVCIVAVAGVSLVYSWTGPPYGGVCSDPPCPPGGNVSAPININTTAQTISGSKTLNIGSGGTGSLGINGALTVAGLGIFNSNVGIGTASPGTNKLQVNGKIQAIGGDICTDQGGGKCLSTAGGASGVSQIIAGTNITISPAAGTGVVTINSTAGGGGIGGSGTANYLSKFTAGTTIGNSQIYDNGTGVGIGSVSPWTKVQIYDGTRYFNIGSYNVSEGALSGIQVSAIGSATGGLGTFYAHNYTTGNTEIASTGGFDLYVNGGFKIRTFSIKQDGHVGIMTLSGGSILTVNGNTSIGSGYIGVVAPNNGLIVEGNVGIGVSFPGSKLSVSGNIATNNRGDIGAIYAGSQGINTYDVFAQWSVRANQLCLGGGATGNGFGDCRTVWPGASDVSLKQNIQTIPSALEKVLQLNGVSFQWKESGKPGIGLVAQDVEKVFPEVVSTNQTSGLKSLEYGNLVGPLVEAIKEQQKQIEELKNEVEKLKQ